MAKQKWITLEDFYELHGVPKNHIYVKRKQGRTDSYVKKIHSRLHIDETYILRRNDFRSYVKRFNENMYHFIKDRGYTASKLASILVEMDDSVSKHSWEEFMSSVVFKTDYTSLLRFKVTNLHWKFFRYSRWILMLSVIHI